MALHAVFHPTEGGVTGLGDPKVLGGKGRWEDGGGMEMVDWEGMEMVGGDGDGGGWKGMEGMLGDGGGWRGMEGDGRGWRDGRGW